MTFEKTILAGTAEYRVRRCGVFDLDVVKVGSDSHMTRDEAIALRDALTEALGDVLTPDPGVMAIRPEPGPEPLEFAVGDRVQVTAESTTHNRGGDRGTVAEVDVKDTVLPYRVAIDGDGDDGFGEWFRAVELEAALGPRFAVGDQVYDEGGDLAVITALPYDDPEYPHAYMLLGLEGDGKGSTWPRDESLLTPA